MLTSFLFCELMDLDCLSVHKHAKKELGEYPAILTLHLFFLEEATFPGQNGWGKSQILVIMRVRVLGSVPLSPIQLFWQ